MLVIPALLPDYLPGLQKLWPAHDPEKILFTRIFEFPFFPPGLFSRLLVRLDLPSLLHGSCSS